MTDVDSHLRYWTGKHVNGECFREGSALAIGPCHEQTHPAAAKHNMSHAGICGGAIAQKSTMCTWPARNCFLTAFKMVDLYLATFKNGVPRLMKACATYLSKLQVIRFDV